MSGLAPLNALRAFEAAARRGGFAAAAEELNVTPAAIGQQVRQLEALIGTALFERQGRKLALTPRGAAALAPLRRGFELMGEASAALRDASAAQTVTLAAPADLAAAWLGVDLARFDGGQVRLITQPPETAFEAGADLALSLGGGPQTADQTVLMGEVLTPLAAPGAVPEGDGAARLEHNALIEDVSAPARWTDWLAARGAYGLDLDLRYQCTDSLSALALAEAGAGVVLARKPLAYDAIRAGRLAPVFADGDLLMETRYVLRPAPGRPLSGLAQRLADHLKACAAARLDLSGEL